MADKCKKRKKKHAMNNILNINTMQSIIRALLTFGAGILVAKGLSSKEKMESIIDVLTSNETIGAFTTVATIVWSIISKRQQVVVAPVVVQPTTITTGTIPAPK